KRLARRRMAILNRPVRAWCLAIRASDTRITPAHWVIVPEHALDLDHPAHPYEPIEHQVIIRPHALRQSCRPHRTDPWGEQVSHGLLGSALPRLPLALPRLQKTRPHYLLPTPPQTLFDHLGYDPGALGTLARRPYCRRAPKEFLRYDVQQLDAPPPTFACGACH